MNINLDDLIPGSSFFKWREALWLPTWGVCVFPTPDQYRNIIKHAPRVDAVRQQVGPMRITSWLRPPKYNEWGAPYGVRGSTNSLHKEGLATDFQVIGITDLDPIRQKLMPKLELLNLRMEDNPGSNWIHIDSKKVGPGENRHFKP